MASSDCPHDCSATSTDNKKRARPADSPLKIDLHTHILPEDIPNFKETFGYGDYIRLDHVKKGTAKMMLGDRFFREVEANCWSCAARVADCDREDVDVQVLSTVPVMFNYNAQPKDTLFISRFLNDHIHRCVQGNPDRFVGLGTLPMQDPALAVVELKRCMEELGFAGVQIGSRINQWNLDEPKLDAFWAEAERLQAAVFIHPWDMDATRAPKYWLPWLVGMPSETTTAICSVIFSGVLTRFPRLKLAFAHGGGQFAFTLGRIEKGFLCRPDLVAVDNNVNPRDFVGKFWVDSLVHDPKSLKFLVDLVGSNRVCLGTDYPFPLGEDHPGKCTLQADLGEKATNDIFHNSALEFLGISRDEARRRFGKDIKN